MKLTPAASAREMILSTSVWPREPMAFHMPASALPPNVMVPRQISDTNMPVLPSWLYFIVCLRWVFSMMVYGVEASERKRRKRPLFVNKKKQKTFMAQDNGSDDSVATRNH